MILEFSYLRKIEQTFWAYIDREISSFDSSDSTKLLLQVREVEAQIGGEKISMYCCDILLCVIENWKIPSRNLNVLHSAR